MYDEAAAGLRGRSGPARPPSCSTGPKDWDTIFEWELPFAKWFVGGKLNVAHNCLDRHVAAGRGDKVAIHFEGEPGDTRTLTYAELLDEVQRFANVLKSLGVAAGRPGQHLPADDPRGWRWRCSPAPASARRTASCSAGSRPQALADRINDAEAKVLITADGGYRRGDVFPLKPAADEAVAATTDDRARRRRAARRNDVDDGRTAATTGTTT